MFELRGRNYAVTGGAQGIGFAVTRAICEMGGNVAVMDIQEKPVDEKEWESLSQKFGSQTIYIQTDVTKQESLNAAFAKAVHKLGSLDGLVPAAGIAIDKPFIDQTWEEFTRIQEINVGFCFTILGEKIPLMPYSGQGNLLRSSIGYEAILVTGKRRQHRTHCIAIKPHCATRLVSLIVSCISGKDDAYSQATSRMAAYNASKGGILMLSKALAVELAPHNIRVNTISPGFVDSDMTRNVREMKSKREGDQMWLAPPLQRLSTQNDLTGAVVYLLSDASRHTTAADIQITGGLHAGTIDGVISYE